MRLFVAVPLPPDLADRASRLLPESLPALRRVKPENLHLTLAFLGETPDGRLEDVATAARQAARGVERFELVFDRAGRFPERGARARVVWLGIGAGLAEIERLAAGLYGELRQRSLRFEDRPLSPHLTLARVPDDASLAEARTVAAAAEALDVPRLAADIQEIVVMQSVLSPRGPRYTTRATAPLD